MEVVGIEAEFALSGWETLVAASAAALMRLALMLTGDPADAEDLLQSTFARASRHGDRIARMTAPMAYLRRVMVNEHTSGRRRRRPMVLLEEVPEPSVSFGSGLADRDEAWHWLATLPPRQRAVLVLRYYEDLPDHEIADIVGCSRATVRSHASHGLASLRSLLTEREEES
jgi:RNA polymerase sigma-70 factor (sigma-E family)